MRTLEFSIFHNSMKLSISRKISMIISYSMVYPMQKNALEVLFLPMDSSSTIRAKSSEISHEEKDLVSFLHYSLKIVWRGNHENILKIQTFSFSMNQPIISMQIPENHSKKLYVNIQDQCYLSPMIVTL